MQSQINSVNNQIDNNQNEINNIRKLIEEINNSKNKKLEEIKDKTIKVEVWINKRKIRDKTF